MADKTSLHGNYPEASDALRKFIESVAKDILLDGKKLTDYQGTLKMYLESEGIDYNSWEHSMNMFLATMIAYRDNPTQALFDVARFPARKSFVSSKCMGYLAHQLKDKQPQKTNTPTPIKNISWKKINYEFQISYFRYRIINTTNNWVYVGGGSSAYPSSVEIPETVSYEGEEFSVVGIMSMAGATFSEIKIPNTILEIGSSAFSGCKCLKQIIIPDSVTKIGLSAFYDCSALSSVTLPKHLTYIPANCFQHTQLSQINLNDSLVEIGEFAFYSSCLQNVVIPDSVRAIGRCAFAENKELKKIVLPKSLNNITDGLFLCDSKLEEVIIPNNVEYIGDEAFRSCGLKKIDIPASVKSIGELCFEGTPLKKISILSPVTIGRLAFAGCEDLDVYILPRAYFDPNAFGKSAKIHELSK